MTFTAWVLVLVATLAGVSAAEPETWVRARSSHVEVLTNGSEALARRAAENIETFHRVLQSALAPLPALAEGSRPPLVLAFRDRQSFRVRTPSGLLRLTADSPRSLFLYDAEGDTVERDLTCGPAALPVTARYVTGPPGTATHRVLSLSFHGTR